MKGINMTMTTNSKALLIKLAEYSTPSGETPLETRVSSIPNNLILKPTMSIGNYLQEAYNLYFYAQDDKENLCNKGLDWRLMDELPRRIDLLHEWEARWYSIRYCETSSAKELKRLHAIIDVSRKELLACMKYAFHGESLARAVSFIERGDTLSDYVQDLSDMVILAEEHKEMLIAVGCDCQHIEILNENRHTFSGLIAACEVDEMNKPVSLNNRNRAYTFLVVAVESIRRAAHYAFWNDKKRLRGYASEHFRKSTRNKEEVNQ
jgi:hypothetical protein